MPQVTGRYIDKNAWHIVITRSGDVIRHERFTALADADAFAAAIETGHPVVSAKRKGGPLSTFNRPVSEMKA